MIIICGIIYFLAIITIVILAIAEFCGAEINFPPSSLRSEDGEDYLDKYEEKIEVLISQQGE